MAFYAPVTDSLNEVLRRLRQYKTEHEWTAAVLDGAGSFTSSCAVFRLDGGTLRALGQRRIDLLPPGYTLPIVQARAFSTAVEFNDSSVTLRIPSEVGPQLSSSQPMDRAHILPISRGDRVVAFLYSEEGEDTDASGLELIAGMASLALRTVDTSTIQIQPALSNGVPAAPEPPAAPSPVRLPDWVHLKPEDRNRHTRAQRFARTRLAQLCLARPEAIEEGLKQGDLYLFLKKEIDLARDQYRAQYMTDRNMQDYIHSELVRVAGGDETKLGAEYPGQMD